MTSTRLSDSILIILSFLLLACSQISDFLPSFARFTSLRTLSFPTNYVDSSLAPSACFHHAQQLEDELREARSLWEEKELCQRDREEERRRNDLLDRQDEMDPEEFEGEYGYIDNSPYEEWKMTRRRDFELELEAFEEEDIDPDDHLLDRLLTSGLLTTRPTPRDFIHRVKPDWIDVASSLPSLRRIFWTLHESANVEIGQIEWDVVRTGPGDVVSLREERSDPDLEVARCMCDFRWEESEVVEELCSLPPLFEQEAKWRPKFTLDGFVASSSRS